jgi:hypothetical protein
MSKDRSPILMVHIDRFALAGVLDHYTLRLRLPDLDDAADPDQAARWPTNPP